LIAHHELMPCQVAGITQRLPEDMTNQNISSLTDLSSEFGFSASSDLFSGHGLASLSWTGGCRQSDRCDMSVDRSTATATALVEEATVSGISAHRA
jgi:hypothetical protein